MHGRQTAAVPGVQRLEQVGRLAPPHLADEDVIRPVAQRVPHEIPDRHAAVAEPPRLEPQAIGAAQPQLQGVLDGDGAPLARQERNERVQQRRLARAEQPPEISTFCSRRSTAPRWTVQIRPV